MADDTAGTEKAAKAASRDTREEILEDFQEYDWRYDVRLWCIVVPPFVLFLALMGFTDAYLKDQCPGSSTYFSISFYGQLHNKNVWNDYVSPLTMLSVYGVYNLYVLADFYGYSFPSKSALVRLPFFCLMSLIAMLFMHHHSYNFTNTTANMVPLWKPSGIADYWNKVLWSDTNMFVFFVPLFVRPLKLAPLFMLTEYLVMHCPLWVVGFKHVILEALDNSSVFKTALVNGGSTPMMITFYELVFFTAYFSVILPFVIKMEYFIRHRYIKFVRLMKIRCSYKALKKAREEGQRGGIVDTLDRRFICLQTGKPPGHTYDESCADHYIRTRYRSIPYPNEERVMNTLVAFTDGEWRFFSRKYIGGISNPLLLYSLLVKDLLYTIFNFGIKFDELVNVVHMEAFHPSDPVAFTGPIKWAFFIVDKIWLRPTAAPKELLGIIFRTIDVADMSRTAKIFRDARKKTENKHRGTLKRKTSTRLSFFGAKTTLKDTMQMNLHFNMELLQVINLPPLQQAEPKNFVVLIKSNTIYKDPQNHEWMSKVIEEIQFHNFKRFYYRTSTKFAFSIWSQIISKWVYVAFSNDARYYIPGSPMVESQFVIHEIAWVVFDYGEWLAVTLFHLRSKYIHRFATDFMRLHGWFWGFYLTCHSSAIAKEIYKYWFGGSLFAMKFSTCPYEPVYHWFYQTNHLQHFRERMKSDSVYDYYNKLLARGEPTPFPISNYIFDPAPQEQFVHINAIEHGLDTSTSVNQGEKLNAESLALLFQMQRSRNLKMLFSCTCVLVSDKLVRGAPPDYPLNGPLPNFRPFFPSKSDVDDPLKKDEMVAKIGLPRYNRWKVYFSRAQSFPERTKDNKPYPWFENFWDPASDSWST